MSCNEKKTVMVFATGGTIAMKYDEAAGGLIPACTGEDLTAAVPGLTKQLPTQVERFPLI